MLPGKVLCKNHACTFAERERERDRVIKCDLCEELLQANSHKT